MSILLGWLSPVRAIFIWIDTIAFSLVDQVYDLFVKFISFKLIDNSVISDLAENIYILMGILAFFRLAVLLINSIISPEKLYEKKTGIGGLFGRVVIMIAALILAPFIFSELETIQQDIVNKNLIQRLILPSAARGVSAKYTARKNAGFERAGKTMQKIVITSLIMPEEEYFEEDFTMTDESGNQVVRSQNQQVQAFINADIPDDAKNGMNFLQTSSGNLRDTSKWGFQLNEECKKICRKAMLQYHQTITDTHRGYNLGRLAGYIGGSRELVDPDDPDGDTHDVYYYEYIAVVTTITAVFLTYVILSWSIDMAVRTVELAVLKIISPLFIATIVDPKSTASGGYFNNFLKRFGKTYADLFIKLAIISFAILGISLIQDMDILGGLISLGGILC